MGRYYLCALKCVIASKCVNAGLIVLQMPSIVTSGCGAKSSALESQIIRGSRFLKKAKDFPSLKRTPLLETLQFEQTLWKAGAFLQGEHECVGECACLESAHTGIVRACACAFVDAHVKCLHFTHAHEHRNILVLLREAASALEWSARVIGTSMKYKSTHAYTCVQVTPGQATGPVRKRTGCGRSTLPGAAAVCSSCTPGGTSTPPHAHTQPNTHTHMHRYKHKHSTLLLCKHPRDTSYTRHPIICAFFWCRHMRVHAHLT